MFKRYSKTIGTRSGQTFPKLVTRYERIGDELVEIQDKFDVDKEINAYADCALEKVLDRFLSADDLNLGSGFREPELDPVELGELNEALSEVSDVYGTDMDDAYLKLKKGGEQNVETQKVEQPSEPEAVPQNGAESA